MTKGICDLHKFLHKAQVRLTQAGSLMVRGLGIMHKLPSINKLGDSYLQNARQTGSERALFVRIDSSTFMSNTYKTKTCVTFLTP